MCADRISKRKRDSSNKREFVDAFFSSIYRGDLEEVKSLIGKVVDINDFSRRGTPLSIAANNGHHEILKLLIENGADINYTCYEGWTALYSAVFFGRLEVVKLLIEHGADIDKPTDNGWTPLHTAAFSGHIDIAKLLIENGADIRACMILFREWSKNNIRNEITSILRMPWTPSTHNKFPLSTRKSIKAVFKLVMKNCQFSRVPRDILLVICVFIACRDI
jgi:ankyrin repeat protein